jgi:polyisoprenoid-binding protein YceI
MKKMRTRILTFIFVLAFSYGMAQETWILDKSHTNIEFNVTHLVISEVNGNFRDFDGKVVSSNEDFEGAEIEFTAEIASIDTDNEQRDNHLKSDDFFNAEQFPHMKFSGVLVKNQNKYQLKGEMTIRDVTKPIVFDVNYNGSVTDPWGNTKAGFKITGTLNRFDYGLKWNTLMEAGGAVVGENVDIICNVELQKQS